MPLKKLQLKPGVNRENTRYTTEGGWYASDKVRFRQGTPEKIGGWARTSDTTFLGICRALWNWILLPDATGATSNILAVGTNTKFYLERSGTYNDITPIRTTTAAGEITFAATNGSPTITVTDVAHGVTKAGSYVTISDAASLGGVITATVLNTEWAITSIPTADTYTITAPVNANASDVGNGGALTVGAYQIDIGGAVASPTSGFGAGTWGGGTWGGGVPAAASLRLWDISNYGEDLIFAPRYGAIYYWDATGGLTARGVNLTTLSGASGVPTIQQGITVSDVSRFVFAFGCNEIGNIFADPLLIRWSDQENAAMWTPAITNQAGGIRLSRGSEIRAHALVRQEVLVWTDAAIYSMQYLGPPSVWGLNMLADNVTCVSPNCVAVTADGTFWMGTDKFYKYDGRVQTLRCDLRAYVFNDMDMTQRPQIFAGTVASFNEVWWFYCSNGSTIIDRYVVYNYAEDIWYYGTMERTAWLDAPLKEHPVAATYSQNIVMHENGVDDNTSETPTAIEAYISSSEFDIDDGDRFAFIYRVLPDMTFDGSTADSPAAVLGLTPLRNSGSGYTTPASVAGSNNATVARTATVPIEAFTGQVYIRVRGRQMTMKISSTALGTKWQSGTMRIDVRPDGRA